MKNVFESKMKKRGVRFTNFMIIKMIPGFSQFLYSQNIQFDTSI